MKQLLAFASALWIGVSFLQSCSRDRTPPPNKVACDSSKTYTYTADVKAIFDNSCATIGCHNAVAPASGVVLDNYLNAKAFTENGQVLCAIHYQPGRISMPASGKLPDSLIQKIDCWAHSGFAN